MAAGLLTVGALRRGYERAAVDQLVDAACVLLDELHATAVSQKTALDGAWTEVQARRDGTLPDHSMTGPVGVLLADSERAAMEQRDEMQRAAGEQSLATVQAAHRRAEQIVAAAQARAAAIDEKAAGLRTVAAGLLRFIHTSATSFTDAHSAYTNELRRVVGPTAENDARAGS
ncbi:hypothetical protein OHQ88_33850 (plasmid) [Micromonospora zamorensis]|uniref:hypothetical protein n=1 Tax=Micromonospora zamorensis TaxID=709883 RepID=UPI002E24245C